MQISPINMSWFGNHKVLLSIQTFYHIHTLHTHKIFHGKMNLWLNLIFRAFLLLLHVRIYLFTFSAGVAMVVPHLDLLISLVGAFASSSLALIVPPIIELVTYSAPGEKTNIFMWTKNLVTATFGVVGFATGTYTTLSEIIKTFQSNNIGTTAAPLGTSTFGMPG